MDFSAAHAGYVFAAYGLSAALLTGLCVYVILRDRSMRADAARLEARRHGTKP